MQERATIVTIAQAAGVSTSTVSQVLRGEGRISEETRRKVLNAAESLDYVYDHRAAAMRSGESRDVGLLIHHIANPFNAEVMVGANAYLEERGRLVYVLDALDDPARQRRYLQTLIGGAPGGLLWVPAIGSDAETLRLVARRCPATVTVLRRPPDSPFDHVGLDNVAGTEAATRHLLSFGHRRIAFLGGDPHSPTCAQRVAGYVATLAPAGIAPMIRYCDETRPAAAEAAAALLTEHPGITGLVCMSDRVAMGAALALGRMGKAAGREVSVVGFDDIEDARLWTPALTTVAVDPERLGREIARMLLERQQLIRDGRAEEPPRAAILPVRLAVRASTGPVPTGG